MANSLGKVTAVLACVAPESRLRLLLGLALAVSVDTASEGLEALASGSVAAGEKTQFSVWRELDVLLDAIAADGQLSPEERQRCEKLMDALGQKRRWFAGGSFDAVKTSTLDKLAAGTRLDDKTKEELHGFIGIDRVREDLARLAKIEPLAVTNGTLGKVIAFLACVPPESPLRWFLELTIAIGFCATEEVDVSRIRGRRSLDRLRRLSGENVENYVARFVAVDTPGRRVEDCFDILLEAIASDEWLSANEDKQLKAFAENTIADETLRERFYGAIGDGRRIESDSDPCRAMKAALQEAKVFERTEADLQRVEWIEW